MYDSAKWLHRRDEHKNIQTQSTNVKNIAWALPGILLTAKQARRLLDNEMLQRMKTVPEALWHELYDYLSHQLEQAHADIDLWYDPKLVKMTPEMLECVKREVGLK